MSTETLAERLDRGVEPEPNTGCYLWKESLSNSGYGQLWHGGRHWKAHTAAWTVKHGPVPPGMFVLHRCDHRPCANADSHLFLGTQKQNVEDMKRKERSNGALNYDQMRNICFLLLLGASFENIGEWFGVAPTLPYRIATRRSWLELTEGSVFGNTWSVNEYRSRRAFDEEVRAVREPRRS
jgi:hypothetical protein